MSDDDKCFWYTEGQCFLEEGKLPEDWIIKWIRKIPAAREDLLKCAMKKGKCDAVPDQYIEWAEELPDIESAEEFNQEFQSFVNRFTDHHRKDFTLNHPLNGEDDDGES